MTSWNIRVKSDVIVLHGFFLRPQKVGYKDTIVKETLRYVKSVLAAHTHCNPRTQGF